MCDAFVRVSLWVSSSGEAARTAEPRRLKFRSNGENGGELRRRAFSGGVWPRRRVQPVVESVDALCAAKTGISCVPRRP